DDRGGDGDGIDGVVVTVEDTSTGRPIMIHASDNLAELLGWSTDDLVGRSLDSLAGGDVPPGELAATNAGATLDGGPVEASHLLRHRSGRLIAVQATHTALPAFGTRPHQRIVVFRRLDVGPGSGPSQNRRDPVTAPDGFAPGHRTGPRSPSTPPPVPDVEPRSGLTPVDALSLSNDLTTLCHQVASVVEARLQGAGRCWVGVTDIHRRLEAVATGEHDEHLVGDVLRTVMGSGDPTRPRSVLVAHLPDRLAEPLGRADVRALWAFPCLDTERRQRGALVVAHTADGVPSDDEVRFLEQLSRVVAGAILRSTAEETAVHRSLHDALTGLPTRTLLIDRLGQAIARLDREPSSLSVLLVDIDRFKAVNDTWGPEVGDRVLVEVASRLLASVRLGDTVGRIASDRFLMICVANAELDASVLARRVIESIEDPVRIPSGADIHITASVGAVAVTEPGVAATAVISKAESALASSVEQGRGGYALFDVDHQRQAVARQEKEQALHTALGRGELVVHYQPVCELASGRMVGAEALIRWERPGHGLVGPGEFIELAEETGLIVPIGEWVIDRVAAEVARWPRSGGYAPVVTVNLSARQLTEPNLVATVTDALRRHQLAPFRLGFEVTESMGIDDVEAAVSTLDALVALGCRIAVDDFGIGHATLDYLRRFSMAYAIKVDRSFVGGLGRSREDTAIVSATLALADALGLKVVAEGVENALQLRMLIELGCDFAQGYAMGAAMPLQEIMVRWEQGRMFDPQVVLDDGQPGTPSSSWTPIVFRNPETSR
ncbi:MAG: putative bifunctional diguanylate cyclase/phosphodiesterase, partial [Acidimicrobiales bacterium]